MQTTQHVVTTAAQTLKPLKQTDRKEKKGGGGGGLRELMGEDFFGARCSVHTVTFLCYMHLSLFLCLLDSFCFWQFLGCIYSHCAEMKSEHWMHWIGWVSRLQCLLCKTQWSQDGLELSILGAGPLRFQAKNRFVRKLQGSSGDTWHFQTCYVANSLFTFSSGATILEDSFAGVHKHFQELPRWV